MTKASGATVERNDLFVHKSRGDVARVNFITVHGEINYRITGSRRCYISKRENFLKNWTLLENDHKKASK